MRCSNGMAATSKTVGGKIIGLFLPIMVFVICGFEHSVANMSYISGGLFSKMAYGNLGLETAGLTWFNFIVKNLLVVTIGNIIGRDRKRLRNRYCILVLILSQAGLITYKQRKIRLIKCKNNK